MASEFTRRSSVKSPVTNGNGVGSVAAGRRTKRFSRSMESLDAILRTLEDLNKQAAWDGERLEVRRANTTVSEAAREAVVARATAAADADGGRARKAEKAKKRLMRLDVNKNNAEDPSQIPVYRYYKSPLANDRPLLVQQSTDLATSNSSLSSIGSHPPPPSPRSADTFVDMLNQDWDTYRSCTSGRLFYHNPTSGETRWKPPRLTRTLSAGKKSASLPRTTNSIFSFGSTEIAEEDDLDGNAVTERVSIVRDSIRRSDESEVVPPPGYTELYDKRTGLISYHDNVRDVTWLTSLDAEGKLYFYTEKDGRSEWELPPVPSALGPKESERAKGYQSPFNVARSGTVHRRGTHAGGKSSGKKWQPFFCVLSDGYLLFFRDELCFRRMQQQPAKGDIAPPDLCVDLSQCSLRWFKRAGRSTSKRSHVVELRSLIGALEINLYWSEEPREATEWFEELRKLAKEVEEPDESTVSSPQLSSLKKDFPSFSAPGTPLLSRLDAGRTFSGGRKSIVEISSPTNFVKASPEELKAKLRLALSDQDLSLLDDALDGPRRPQAAFSPNAKFKNTRKVGRGQAFSQSFRKMAETVHLRPKTAASRLSRIPSGRSKLLSKFFDPKADDDLRRASKDDLIMRGILRNENVFGNDLKHLKKDPGTGLPEFVVRCVARVEEFMDTVGVYRINGDAALVQKIRLDVDHDNYKLLESTNDVSLLASTLKLFFRELPEPLIPKQTRELLHECAWEKSSEKLVARVKAALEQGMTEPISRKVLGFLMLHLHKVSQRSVNKMDSKNLATVFSPNLVHSVTRARRPESLISEMEMNNVFVERLIANAREIFK